MGIQTVVLLFALFFSGAVFSALPSLPIAVFENKKNDFNFIFFNVPQVSKKKEYLDLEISGHSDPDVVIVAGNSHFQIQESGDFDFHVPLTTEDQQLSLYAVEKSGKFFKTHILISNVRPRLAESSLAISYQTPSDKEVINTNGSTLYRPLIHIDKPFLNLKIQRRIPLPGGN